MRLWLVGLLFIVLWPRVTESMCYLAEKSSAIYDATVLRCGEFNPRSAGPTRSAGLWLETYLHAIAIGEWEDLKHLADLRADQLGARSKPSPSAEFYLHTDWRPPSCDTLIGKRLRIYSSLTCCDVRPPTQPACYYHGTPLSELSDVPHLDAARFEKRSRPLFLDAAAIDSTQQKYALTIYYCHVRADAAKEKVEDSNGLLVNWRIGTDGRPHHVRLGGPWRVTRTAFSRCLQDTIATKWAFPPSDTESMLIEYRFDSYLSPHQHVDYRIAPSIAGLFLSAAAIATAILGALVVAVIFPPASAHWIKPP